MIKFFIPMLLLAFLLSSCQSCLSKFYGVHEKMTPINLTFEQDTSSHVLDRYIDSCNQSKKGDRVNCIPPPIVTEENDRIICFSDSPCESYFLSIKNNKVAIVAVYIPHLNNTAWLTKSEQVNDTLLYRVEQRFRNKVLNKL